MNPTSSEENLMTTPKLDTNPVTTVTYTSTSSVPQVTSSTSYVPLDLSTHNQPPRHPIGHSYNSSGYQRSFLNYQECPVNFDRPDCTYSPSKVTEIYNIYCLNDHQNHIARRTFERGWISLDAVKRIYHRGFAEAFEGYQQGFLPPHLIDNMINYGKFYKYLP